MKRQHILVAEDEKTTNITISFVLRQAGYRVTSIENGQEALDQIVKLKDSPDRVDFLVSDIQMPGLTGLQLIDRLEEMKIAIPILVLTGFGDKDIVIELMRKGVSEYLDKPFESGELVKRVSGVLDKAEKLWAENQAVATQIEQEKARLNRELEAYRLNFEKLRKQVDLAVDAYQSLVHIQPDLDLVNVVYRHQSLADLGGDFFDIRKTAAGCDILVADVSGHDMGASYHTVLLKAFFDENSRIGKDGRDFFRILNTQLLEHGKNERMVTAIFVRLDFASRQGEVVTAGHPPLIRLDSQVIVPQPVYTDGDVLGLSDQVDFESRTFPLATGDRLFLHTDGFVDAYRINGLTGAKIKFSEAGFDDLINKYRKHAFPEMVDAMWRDVLDFCRNKPHDDMLLVGLEIR
ncbi:MAG: SpoIIE family protein phosphatase [Deltaproteobacteria bacterium]|nr:SpoIIE family protein phosphatase [Deltaproteobacteria bacterium]